MKINRLSIWCLGTTYACNHASHVTNVYLKYLVRHCLFFNSCLIQEVWRKIIREKFWSMSWNVRIVEQRCVKAAVNWHVPTSLTNAQGRIIKYLRYMIMGLADQDQFFGLFKYCFPNLIKIPQIACFLQMNNYEYEIIVASPELLIITFEHTLILH